MDHVWSILLLLRPWMSYNYTVIQVICWVELPEQMRLCPIFLKKNLDPDKWDTTAWYRVTRNPQEFRGLMSCPRDPRIWGVTVSTSSRTMASFPCLAWSSAFLVLYLACLPRQKCVVSLPGPGDDRFHAAGAQRNPAAPSSALLVPPASFPYLDANAGIGPRATESPDCSTLQLC